MGEKVTFDPVNLIVQIDEAPTLVGSDWIVDIDVEADLYSDGKEDWLIETDLHKLKFFMGSTGGDSKPGGQVGKTFFLEGGWQVRPYEDDHWLRVVGNLFTRDGSNPFVSTVGNYNVVITQSVSDLVGIIEVGTSGLTAEESAKLTNIDSRTAYQIRIIDNKRILVKESSTWYLEVFSDNGLVVILKKALKDSAGDEITDLAAGALAQELANSV
jgi:hypothetical protein